MNPRLPAAALALLLVGCQGGRQAADAINRAGSPIARADEGATASVVLIACPQSVAGGAIVQEVINAAMAAGELAVAGGGGTARVVIDTCPGGPRADVIAAASRRLR